MAPQIKFGQRNLDPETDVFSHNAWDNVELDQEMQQEAFEKIKIQLENKLLPAEAQKYHNSPFDYWNAFYSKNSNKFFKDRKWLRIEFPELFQNKKEDPFTICEIGCGAGNTVFPFLEQQSGNNVFCYACDYSSEAIKVVVDNPLYNPQTCKALVFGFIFLIVDITSDCLSGIEPESVDVCICIFVLSAIHPDDWHKASDNIYKMLKPGGLLLFRDYGRYDLAQLRFKPGRLLQENFYVRGDGTRCYFFTNQEVQDIFSRFKVVENGADKRLIVNRERKIKMYRCWLQAKFQKE
jgi:tRNAThr (cytosine32-N3)-methyltransferase